MTGTSFFSNQWQTSWKLVDILNGLLFFMEADPKMSENVGVGSIFTSLEEKLVLAESSQNFRCAKCGYSADRFKEHLAAVEGKISTRKEVESDFTSPSIKPEEIDQSNLKNIIYNKNAINEREQGLTKAHLPSLEDIIIPASEKEDQSKKINLIYSRTHRENPVSFTLSFGLKEEEAIKSVEEGQEASANRRELEQEVYTFTMLEKAREKLDTYRRISQFVTYENKGLNELKQQRNISKKVKFIEFGETILLSLFLIAVSYVMFQIAFDSFAF